MGDLDAPAHQDLQPLRGESALGSCGSLWFYYQWWLAKSAERSAMVTVWLKEWRFNWDWWKTGNACRMTRMLPMLDVLKRQFGDDWTSPKKSIVRV